MGMHVPELGPKVPKRGNAFSRWLGRTILRLKDWRFEGEFPDYPQLVVIVAPHTSNWDFIVGYAAKLALGIDARFLGKHTLFRFPLGGLMRWLGGTPVDRSMPKGVVEQVVEWFEANDCFVLGLSPEGTRRRIAPWKTGFHRIARAAAVPILPVYLDYGRRVIGFGEPFEPTEHAEVDLRRLGLFFEGITARHPEQFALPSVEE